MRTAEEILGYLAELLLNYLEELKNFRNTPSEQFAYGERTAYTECLEIIQYWEQARECGLDFDIEIKYPL